MEILFFKDYKTCGPVKDGQHEEQRGSGRIACNMYLSWAGEIGESR